MIYYLRPSTSLCVLQTTVTRSLIYQRVASIPSFAYRAKTGPTWSCYPCTFLLCILVIISVYASRQEPATAQQSFSKSREPAVFRIIPSLEFLQESWENMTEASKFTDLQAPIEKGLDNLRKWYRKVDDTDVYFICLGMSCII